MTVLARCAFQQFMMEHVNNVRNKYQTLIAFNYLFVKIKWLNLHLMNEWFNALPTTKIIQGALKLRNKVFKTVNKLESELNKQYLGQKLEICTSNTCCQENVTSNLNAY